MTRSGTRRVAVVTGATGGIGLEVATGIARAGMHAVLVGRDPVRLQAAQARIETSVPGASVEAACADLSLLEQTEALARRLGRTHPEIALLVNNAGVFATRRELTAEGRERVLATNHLAPFVLTRGLVRSLRAGAGPTRSRVINVGSVMAGMVGIDPDDLELERGWRPVRAYGRSKLALAMATFDWALSLAPDGVSVSVVHPGSVRTGIVRSGLLARSGWWLMRPVLITPQQGAGHVLRAALSPALEGSSGLYWRGDRPGRPNRLALDPALRRRVLRQTERLAA